MAGEAEGERRIRFKGGVAQKSGKQYAGNAVKTSKYTPLTFVPMNLWEQLHKFGNVYFLVISVIMYLGETTPLFVGTIKAFSTLGLLLMMMSITAAMSLFDDLRRKKADEEINASKSRVVSKISRGRAEDRMKSWAQVSVGDIIVVEKDDEFPADVVPLYCSGEGGNCYVSTANLDGETNLKLKTAPTATQCLLSRCSRPAGDLDPTANLHELHGEIRTEPPNSNIHDFSGSMQVDGFASESLGAKQLLMRGTVLRNTALCLAIVVYTGPDTRMVRNSRPAPLKQSNLEMITNVAMGIILVAQILFALATAVLHVNMTPLLKGHWYLYPSDILLPELLGWWLTFLTLYSNLMPISLYPTAEFCNAFQCYFIRNDRRMYYKRPDFNNGVGFGASARSSNLCQELGQVGFMFSDKTGTLTQNDMELKRLSIAGQRYGTFEGPGKADGFNGGNDLQAARRGSRGQAVDAFLEALAVSHTVMATPGKDGKLTYEAESPDEFALVAGVAEQGWAFQGRRGNDVMVSVTQPGKPNPVEMRYTVLATNAFNSSRKRMSVVVQKGSEYFLFVKGADNVMLERAAAPDRQLEVDLKEFSVQGLRTLVIGQRQLTKTEVDAWKRKYDWAQRETEQRDQKLEDIAEEIEKSLQILGATAIEDKLQDGVPETIEKIRFAGIKLWVLTGDKLETARNIGFSTRVLTQEMDIRTVDEEEGSLDLDQIESDWEDCDPGLKAMMITGKALSVIMPDPDYKERLLRVSTSCSVLIACRVSPSQKADLVRFIRQGIQPAPVTLAVGDGANDVPMIQEAQVGIGIAGREGRQAVNNSDFAIAQFRYLQRLLLVHGRWNYRRACKFTLFTFWRNMVQVLMIMYYTLMSGYSGTSLYEDWIRLSFNLLCTLPILAVGCMDEDVSAKTSLEHPELYSIGRLGKDLNPKKTVYTISAAFAHSFVLYFLTIPAFPGMELFGTGDYYTFGTTCYTCLLLDVNYRAGFITNTHNAFTMGSIALSFVMYIFWLIAYPQNQWLATKLAPNMYMVPEHMIKSPYFWLCVIAVPLFAMMTDVYISFNYHHFFPDVQDKVSQHYTNKTEQQDVASSADLAGLVSSGSDEGPSSGNYSDSDSDGVMGYDSQDKKQIDLSSFAQQRLWSYRIRHSRPYLGVVYTGFLAGTVLLAMGLTAIHYSESCDQIRVTYAESPNQELDFISRMWSHFPMGTRSYEKASANCTAGADGGQICQASVLLVNGMRKPLLYYAVGPYYQNYNAYMKSEVIPELMGQEVSQAQREKMCVKQTLVDGTGQQIVPCGMKATSVFNDTFQVLGYSLRRENTAWRSDVERYNNPDDYKRRPNTSWLYQRYPDTIPEDQGVKTSAFADWMRPSAVPRVWNRYGYLNETFPEGSTLHLQIHSRYPIDTIPGGYKVIVVTEYGAFGARHSGFGYILTGAGVLCFVLAMIAWATYRCCPSGLPWLQRLVPGEESDQGYDSDSKSEESP